MARANGDEGGWSETDGVRGWEVELLTTLPCKRSHGAMEHPPNVYCILVCKSIWFACIETLKDDHTLLEIRNPFAIDGQISWKKELIWYEYRYARNESYSVTEWVVHEQHQRMGPSIPNPWWSPTKSKVPWNSFWVRKLSMYLLYWIIFVGCISQTNIRPPRKSFPYIHVYPTIMLFLFQALLSRSHLFFSTGEECLPWWEIGL